MLILDSIGYNATVEIWLLVSWNHGCSNH